MLDMKKVTDFTAIVKGRILEKEEKYKEIDFSSLSVTDQICHIVDRDQLKHYKEFITEFEDKVLKMTEDDYGPAL